MMGYNQVDCSVCGETGNGQGFSQGIYRYGIGNGTLYSGPSLKGHSLERT